MKVILLAAGFGTRLYPLTRHTPKALLPLGERPLIDHLMENVAKARPALVTLITNGRFYEPFEHWKSKQKYPFPFHLLNNGINIPEERKGAVCDLYSAFRDEIFPGDPTLVILVDNYFDYPLNLFLLHALHHLPEPVIGVYDVRDREEAKKYGIVELDSDHTVRWFEEKPENPSSTLASVGIYLLPKDAHVLLHEYLNQQGKEKDRIGAFIRWMTNRTRTLAIPLEGVWEDIGDLEAYQRLSRLLEEKASQ